MTHGFRRSSGRVVAWLDDAERDVLLGLLQQTHDLLLGGGDGGTPGPPGPASAEPAEPAEPADPFEMMMRAAGFGSGGVEADPGASAAGGGADAPPEDPALRRLLPDGHRDDPKAAAEFRRLTTGAVRRGKLERLSAATAAVAAAEGGVLALDEPSAHALLVALTDVRLVLGERIGLRTDEDADGLSDVLAGLDQDDPLFALVLSYEYLTWLQETLASALLPR